jgi:DNA-binding response OmpR family regulator
VLKKDDPETEKNLRGTETILLVEDEEMFRTRVREILEAYGYTVIETASGADGLLIFERDRKTIDMLLTSAGATRARGKALATSLLKIRPRIKILFMSDLADPFVVRHGGLVGKANFIHKPFTPRELAQRVRKILDEIDNQTLRN